MTNNTTRWRKYAAAGAILLVAGSVATGGALVTRSSTILDNVFGVDTNSGSVNPGVDSGLVVTGDPMSHTFAGLVDGESTSSYFTVTNTSTTADATVDVTSLVHPSGTPELAGALHTRIGVGGVTVESGALSAMSIPAADRITVPADSSVAVRVDVLVPDAIAFTAAGFTAASETTVDFQFDAIFRPAA